MNRDVKSPEIQRDVSMRPTTYESNCALFEISNVTISNPTIQCDSDRGEFPFPELRNSYFDNHKSYWKTQPSPRVSSNQLAKSKMAHKQMNNLAETSLKNLQASFDSGKMSSALKIAQDLLLVSGGFHDPTRYQIAAYHYLSLIHVALGRHDRAVCSVARLIRLSKSTADVNLICRSLVTLGKVHLSFGHLEAAAKAWEHLAKDLKKPIPVAWIRHEIGRCYLETGKYERAMEMGFRCVDAATKGNSKKWMLNGRLLIGEVVVIYYWQYYWRDEMLDLFHSCKI